MAPSQYMCHVNSRPTDVSNQLWKVWYTKEHLPELVKSGASDRATFYEEIPHPYNAHPKHSRKFLALCQSKFAELLKSEEYSRVPQNSALFDIEGARFDTFLYEGDFDARYYELIQDYDTKGIGEKPAAQILTVYMNPEDPGDFDKWYREEHLPLLSKMPGYRRSLRYKLCPTQSSFCKGSGPEEVQPYLAVHEVDDVSAFNSEESKAAGTTAWTAKHLSQSKPVIIRAFKLLSAEGY